MTGPEHFKTAEALLFNAWKRGGPNKDQLIQTPERRAELIETAKAHLMAAQVAALVQAAKLDEPDGGLGVPTPWHLALTNRPGGAS